MKYRILCALILLFQGIAWAQDPHFTQFYANPLYTNPALAGTGFRDGMAAGRVAANYRNQWNGIFNTFCLGWDQAFDAIHGALGAQYIMDVRGAGTFTFNELNVQYAYAGQNKKQTFQYRVGGRMSYVNGLLDRTKLIFGDQLDSFQGTFPQDPNWSPPSSLSVRYPNFGLGILMGGTKWNAGIQIANLIEPNNSFYQNPDQVLLKRWVVHGGYAFKINSHWQVTPQIQGMKQGSANEVLLGTLVNWNELFSGAWIRQNFGPYHNVDAVAINIGYGLNGFRAMYSYDITVSDARHALPFSHEFSLQFRWKTKQKSTFQSLGIY